MSAGPEQSRKFSPWFLRVVALAAVYWGLGKAGLLLAAQPGYASPLWPPAGVAFVALLVYRSRLWPGVFLGSFLVNAPIAYDASSTIGAALLSVAPAAGTGLAAALQAVVGAALVRRFVGYPSALVSPREILRFLVLGGPVGCLISSTLSIAVLVASGAVLGSEALISWSAWWAGDSLGVLILAPLLLIFLGKPQSIWRRRKYSLGLPLLLTLGGALLLSLYSNALEERRIRLEFERQSAEMANSIRRRMSEALEILYSLRSFYESSVEVDRDEFDRFVWRSSSRHPEIQAIVWAPRVYAAGRSSVEGVARADGLEGYRIWEYSSQGEVVPAGDRPEYFPIFYLEPKEGNERAFGFDLGSEENRVLAMIKTEETGEPAATRPLRLVQETENRLVTPIYLAVSGEMAETPAAKERHDQLRGFVTMVLRMGDVVDDALKVFDSRQFHLDVADVTIQPEGELLYRYRPGAAMKDSVDGGGSTVEGEGQGDGAGIERALPPILSEGVKWDVALDVGARAWELRFRPDRSFIYGHRSWGQWLVLAGGLLFTGLLGMLLLIVTGHTARVEALVADRTRELDEQTRVAVVEASEARIARDQAERAEEALLKKTEELERSNKDLEKFAYVASHDLQEPLRMVTSYMQLLERRYADQLDGDGKDFIRHAAEGAGRMRCMIRDLLDYSRITARGREFSEVDCEKILGKAETNLKVGIQESGAAITHKPLPKVSGDETLLLSLFQNLLSNSVKYRDEKPPRIQVSAVESEKGEEWVFSFRDNGIGIKPEHGERIFSIFQRLHRMDEYSGTGIGLAICRKIVEWHGGRIWMEPASGGGSVFKFTLPIRGS